jgi:hypothetical protein
MLLAPFTVLKRGTLALAPAALLTLAACSSSNEELGLTPLRPGLAGGVRVETYKQTATVTSIDRASRKVTLVDREGTRSTLTAGPEVANFAQLEMGDQVEATMTEQLVVFVRKPGDTFEASAAAAVVLAPLGTKPGGILADTVEITAKLKSLDVRRRKATLLFPDGTTRTFKVRRDVDLTRHAVGDEVVIRATEAIAILVEKP